MLESNTYVQAETPRILWRNDGFMYMFSKHYDNGCLGIYRRVWPLSSRFCKKNVSDKHGVENESHKENKKVGEG